MAGASALSNIQIPTIGGEDAVAASATGGNGGKGGGGGGGKGGGGGGVVSDRAQYYMIYRAICQVLGIPLNKKIAAMAYKTRQPGSGFLSLVRKFDPKYVTTNDFKNRAAAYRAKWKEMLPGKAIKYNDLKKFVRGDWSTDRVEQYIMKTKTFKTMYPYFQYGVDDYKTYYAHGQALAHSLAAANLGALTDRRKELFYKLDMTPEEVDQRIEELITGKDAVDLMYGQAGRTTGQKRINDYIFNTPGNLARRQVLRQAFERQQGFNAAEGAKNQMSRDQRGKLIQTGV